MGKYLNTNGGRQICPWCDNTGFYELVQTLTFKTRDLRPYEEQRWAACGFCELGMLKHERWGGPWKGDYKLQDIDVVFGDDQLLRMGFDEQDAYRRIRQARAAMEARQVELRLPRPRPPRLDADAYSEPGPGPDTLEVDRMAESHHPHTEPEGDEPWA